MRFVRRLYFYLVALISVQVVIWGVITLIRDAILRGQLIGTSSLAVGLSLVLVGLPIFFLHWSVVQRDAVKDVEERTSVLRALFLYILRMTTLIAALQNLIAILNRSVLSILGAPTTRALLGGGETLGDNLTVIVINLIAWFYFEQVLRAEWQTAGPKETLREVRRLQRYLWVAYSLGLTIAGTQQIIAFLAESAGGVNPVTTLQLGNALALTLVGAPLWVWCWQVVQRALAEQAERDSLLRLGVLYLFSLGGCAGTLTALGFLLYSLLIWIFGEPHTVAFFLQDNQTPLSSAIVLGTVWAYFGAILQQELAARSDPLRRAELSRPYAYILALAGNATTFIGLWVLVNTLVELVLVRTTSFAAVRSALAGSLAAAAVGLPVWLRYWQRAQIETLNQNDLSDHARRSVVRKIYLYLVVFATVVTGMITAGMLFYLVLDAILGIPEGNFWLDFWQLALPLGLTAAWLVYHLTALRQDARQAQLALAEKHAAFPVTIILPADDPLAAELPAALERIIPGAPVALRTAEDLSDASGQSEPALAVLPASLALDPPSTLRTWLGQYRGKRLLIPADAQNWLWLGLSAEHSAAETAKEIAGAVRRLAEGQELRPASTRSGWQVVIYIAAGLFGLVLLMMLASLGISLIAR